MERRIFELTVSEFIELLKQEKTNVPSVLGTEKKYIHSIKGMADELHMSIVTMQKLKNSGRIPYKQEGRKVIFELNEVLNAMSVNNGRRVK